ncbi:MAG: YdcF family protein [Anaerolineae bacterium]|nr:YdcF family protein [Anaerolineae bacterium]
MICLLEAIGDFLVVSDDPQPADLIHVLGGNYHRGEYAAELYHQGYANALFFTGQSLETNLVARRDNTPYAQALAHGVDPAAILPVDHSATSTYEEALILKQLLHDRPAIQSVIIVSDGYHMRRVRWTFGRVIDDRAKLIFVPIPAEMSPVLPHWWQSQRSRQTIKQEYTKLLYYALVYLW